jgi:hypothetical protein
MTELVLMSFSLMLDHQLRFTESCSILEYNTFLQ